MRHAYIVLDHEGFSAHFQRLDPFYRMSQLWVTYRPSRGDRADLYLTEAFPLLMELFS